MDKPTSEPPRICEVCGKPLRRDNKSGICGSGNPACKAEWDRRHRDRLLGPATGRCELCGGPLQRNNTSGICKSNPSCVRERRSRARRKLPTPPAKCAHPDGCPNPVRVNGLCNMHALRLRLTGELGPAGSKKHPIIIHAGDRFGRLTALEDYGPGDPRILCRCECGAEKRIRAKSLVDGRTRSCGCLTGPRQRRKTRIMRPGEVYGRLTILEEASCYDDLVLARCECGMEAKKQAGLVKAGKVRSCGCGRGRFTHGLSKHPLYGIWRGIVGRCTIPGNAAYPKYGGDVRRITVCKGWQGTPEGLLSFAADMGPRPGMEYTVDRYPDNNGGYWCGHCDECKQNGWPPNFRWATGAEQSENQRKIATLTLENSILVTKLEEAERLLAKPVRKHRIAPAGQGTLF